MAKVSSIARLYRAVLIDSSLLGTHRIMYLNKR